MRIAADGKQTASIFHGVAAGLTVCLLGEALIELDGRAAHAIRGRVIHCALTIGVGVGVGREWNWKWRWRRAEKRKVVGVKGVYGGGVTECCFTVRC